MITDSNSSAAPSPSRGLASTVEHGRARADESRLDALIAIAKHCGRERTTHYQCLPGRSPRHVKQHLEVKHLRAHLTPDGPFIGLAPMAPGDSTTRIALLDYDSHKGEIAWPQMVEITGCVSSTLTESGVVLIAFRSKGGQGVHQYALWDQPQDAFSVRQLFTDALAKHGLKPGAKGVKAGEVEVFPKSDTTPADGYGGAMFVLPFAGKGELLDKSIDLRNLPKSADVPVRERGAREDSSASAPGSANLQELQRALGFIPNDGVHADSPDYDLWWSIIAAIHHASGGSEEGRALAHWWSSRNPKYSAEFLDDRVWAYLK